MGGQRPTDAAAQVAHELFTGWVQNDPAPPVTEAELSESLWPRFQSKWRLYREATVLALLLSREQRDARYSELVKEWERLILPSERPIPEGMAKTAALDSAMKDISELIQRGKGNELRWSRDWFEQLGELPDNPVTCMMFGLAYLNFYIAVAESLEKIAGEGIVP